MTFGDSSEGGGERDTLKISKSVVSRERGNGLCRYLYVEFH